MFDVGSLNGDGGWAISFDIGRLSVILGDLVGRYGLKLAWYRGEWSYFVEVTNRGLSSGYEKA